MATLENMLVFAALPLLAWGYRTLPFTRSTYACLFVFLVLHAIGAHYTYSEVPYDRAFEAVTGASLNALLGWERNHYDRMVHFLYGLLVTPAAIEILQARAAPRGLWRWLLTAAIEAPAQAPNACPPTPAMPSAEQMQAAQRSAPWWNARPVS